MTGDSMMFKTKIETAKASPPSDRSIIPAVIAAKVHAEPKRCRTMDLDMGEGSREQGFRLNGCR